MLWSQARENLLGLSSLSNNTLRPKSNGSYVIEDLWTFIFLFQGKFPLGGKAAKDLEEIQVKADSFI